MSIARECAPLTVRAAVPTGHTIPQRTSQWLDQALAHPITATMPAQAWRTYRAVVRAIANGTDPRTKTTIFSWASLANAVREADPAAAHSRATIARYLAKLRRADLLGTVASGRTAQYAPKGDGTGTNERAVYVLASPRHLRAVDADDTPPLREGYVSPRTHVRGGQTQAKHRDQTNNILPLRGPSSAAQARPERVPAPRREPLWPGGRTPSSKDEMLTAAGELQRRLWVLRQITTKHVRSLTRAFFLAGWTPSDIVQALDVRPNGQRWPHDGATGVTNHGAWFAYRLSAWKDAHGTIQTSHSQHSAARQRQQAAHARARRDSEAALRRQAAPASSPGQLYARAVAEALRTGRPMPPPSPPRHS